MENPLPDGAGNVVTANRSLPGWAAAVAFAALLWGCREPSTTTFALRVEPDSDDPLRVEVVVVADDARAWHSRQLGSPETGNWENVLSFRVGESRGGPAATVACDYRINGNELRLRPRYRVLAGEAYQATFNPRALGRVPVPIELTARIATYRAPVPPAETQPGSVAIYPSGDRLPANHLKFYLVFPAPMRSGVFLNHLKLIDDRGAEVPEPFRETELWSDDARRLTLWLHPGRQKTGVNLNLELGPVLQPGRNYRLLVAGDWPTQQGAPLGITTEKAFTTGPAEHARLVLTDWRIEPPRAGSREPLTVEFTKPLDWALLTSQLHVARNEGTMVNGRVQVGAAETSWRFYPDEPWSANSYQLQVATLVEDLAGNSLARPFEVDLEQPPASAASPKVTLDFTVRPAPQKNEPAPIGVPARK